MTPEELILFEDEVASRGIPTPHHLSGGNERELIDIFKEIKPTDWVFTSYRNHYHALLYGVPRAQVMAQIIAGRSMTPHYPTFKFFSSALVGGQIPPAVGVAAALKRRGSADRVWCFVGDMAAMTGVFHEAVHYAGGHKLPIIFVVEDNGLACDTPTREVWGEGRASILRYSYTRVRPHLGAKA